MADEPSFRAEAAAEYDRAFSHVSAHFLPFVLRAARLAPGQRVPDVATGTGISGEAALDSSAQADRCWPPTSRRRWWRKPVSA
jgi:hypothetical protein